MAVNGTQPGADHHQNGDQKTSGPLKRSAFRALVQDFSPIWFTWCMNSGIIAILLHQHPYRFNGINTLACIFFGIDFVLFLVFSAIFFLRMIMFGKQMFQEITGDIAQLCLLACWPIAWLTLCDLVALLVSTAWWGQPRHWATIAAYVMWWFAAGWILATAFFVFIIVSRRSMAKEDAPMPTMIIIPPVGLSTTALTGAVVVSYGYEASARLAVPAIITGFVVVGVAIIMGIILCTVLWRGFFIHGFPAPEQTASLFILIGPMGQSAAALLALGSAADTYHAFAVYNRGTFITASAAPALSVSCTLIALMLVGTGAFFLLYSIYGMVERAVLKQLGWNMGWNSIIFPWGTLVTATTLLSVEMDSPTFAVLTSIQLIILVIIYLGNLVGTVLQISKGQLLITKEDPRIKKEIEEMEKEK